MRDIKPEAITILVLFIVIWICTLFLVRHHTHSTLDAQASACNDLRQVVEKTREFAMSQPNEVRVIFRNLGYNVTMTPAVVPDSATTQVEP